MVRRLSLFALLLISASPTWAYQFDVDVDSDRTGVVDGSVAEDAVESTQSAILLNNCDRESTSTSFEPDNADAVVNGASDLLDMEEIILRRFMDTVASVTISIQQHSSDSIPIRERIRIFGPDGNELIGPATGVTTSLSSALLAQLRDGDIKLHAEGLAFATSVTLEVHVDGDLHDSVILEVAPLLFTPHSLHPTENYVTLTGDSESQAYVNAFQAACTTAGVTPVVIRSQDVWVEDELTWAFTESPKKRIDVAFHMLRRRPLQTKVKALLGPDVGWAQAFSYDSSSLPNTSLTYGGNVEVSPPTPSHPFGRVYYGSITLPDDLQNTYNKRKFHQEFRDFFLRNSKLQDPIDLHTNWLAVGHIDELISFVPKTDGSGSIMLVSSPKLGFDILRTLPPGTPLDTRYELEFGLRNVGDFFRVGSLQRTLEDYNMEIDRRVFGSDHANSAPESIKGIMMSALGIAEQDVVEVPTVFFNADQTEWAALALTPGVVNLSSMGTYSLVPDPFLDEFKTATQSAIAQNGRAVIWIDNWVVYHVNAGEVHCGSQERRNAFSRKWWQ